MRWNINIICLIFKEKPKYRSLNKYVKRQLSRAKNYIPSTVSIFCEICLKSASLVNVSPLWLKH